MPNQVQYIAIISPEDATDQSVTWSVENITGEAAIDQNGLVTAMAPGAVKVIAAANDGGGATGEKYALISEEPILVESIAAQGAGTVLFAP